MRDDDAKEAMKIKVSLNPCRHRPMLPWQPAEDLDRRGILHWRYSLSAPVSAALLQADKVKLFHSIRVYIVLLCSMVSQLLL